jgi:hypothetical protein
MKSISGPRRPRAALCESTRITGSRCYHGRSTGARARLAERPAGLAPNATESLAATGALIHGGAVRRINLPDRAMTFTSKG